MPVIRLQRSTSPIPCPALLLQDTKALASWHADRLADAYTCGQREISLPCLPQLALCPMDEGCAAIVDAVQEFLSHHSDIACVTLLWEEESISAALTAALE